MNRYSCENRIEDGIFKRMATLRSHKKIIEKLSTIHSDNARNAQLASKKELHAIWGIFSQPEAISYLETTDLYSDCDSIYRSSKISTMFKTSVDAEFIVLDEDPMAERDAKYPMYYYRISDKGSDLLHPLGMFQLYFEKYSKSQLFALGLATSALGYLAKDIIVSLI